MNRVMLVALAACSSSASKTDAPAGDVPGEASGPASPDPVMYLAMQWAEAGQFVRQVMFVNPLVGDGGAYNTEHLGPCYVSDTATQPPVQWTGASAGLLQVYSGGANDSLKLMPTARGYYSPKTVTDATRVWTPPYRLSLDGGGGTVIPTFGLGSNVIAPATFMTPPAAIDHSIGLTLKWTGGGMGTTVAVIVDSRGGADDYDDVIAVCEFALNGQGTVPASVTSRLVPGTMASVLIGNADVVNQVNGELHLYALLANGDRIVVPVQ